MIASTPPMRTAAIVGSSSTDISEEEDDAVGVDS